MSNRDRSIRTEGIVLRRKDFGESDRILTLFTKKLGKVSAIAKGCRKPSSKLSGHVELFMRSSFLIAIGRNLHIISQAENITSYEGLRKDLHGVGIGSYVIELIDAVTYDEGSNLKLYELLISTLEYLESGKPPAVTLRYFDLHTLDLVGFRPEVFQCVECGRKIIEQDQFISGELGGVVCPGCAGKASGVDLRPISSRVLKYLRHIQRSKIQDLFNINVPPGVEEGLEKVIGYYLGHTLEKHLNSPDFIKRVRENSPHYRSGLSPSSSGS
jgi:DNA repair protein RecO (recombination protein O)